MSLEKRKDFYNSYAWLRLRFGVLSKHGFKCLACGRTQRDGAILQVDHIKPRSLFPRLELDESNLQVLCIWLGKYLSLSKKYREVVLAEETQASAGGAG